MNSTQFIISTVWFFAIGLVGYFFLVTRPMLQKEESQKKFVSSLKKGDEVVTSGGIFAKVVSAAADVVTIEIAPNVRVRVLPEHVSPVPKAPSAKAEEK